MNKINIIPMPKCVKEGNGDCKINATISFPCEFSDYASTFIKTAKKLFSVDFTEGEDGIALKSSPTLDKEEYVLTVSDSGVVIEASGSDGINNGIATLYQLITVDNAAITVPACVIKDKPDCSYRALMIDMPANYRTFDEVLHYIDICYLYKVKYAHMHFSDYQGYNLPSKKFPKLPTPDANYTVEQINEMRKYAADRGVVIIPEVDVPGHATYLNVAYPELFGCDPIEGEAREDLVCIGKPGVMDNLKAIFEEVIELFPDSPYIHIGGDEAHIDAWNNCKDCKAYMDKNGIKDVHALYTHSIKLLTDMILSLGRTPIVWEGFPRDGAEQISRDVIVTAWESLYHLPNELLEEGFTITNASWMPLYVVRPEIYDKDVPGGRWHPKDILCDWNIYTWKNWWEKSYAYKNPIVVEPTDKVIGATICSWVLNYKGDVFAIEENLAAMCEKIWNINTKYSIEEFEINLKKLVSLAEKLAP